MPDPTNSWTEPSPEIPYRPRPAPQPASWLVEHPPVIRDASPEARALLHFLYGLSGRHTLTGQHNFPGRPSFSTDLAIRETGTTPALYGTDWGFAAAGDKDSAYERHDLVRELVRRWHGGSIITLCWHAAPPTEDEPVTFAGSVQSRLTGAEFDALLTPGTALHKHWCVQVDVIAEYLKQLRDARVPVLWRPFHEINGDWFWWNGYRGGDTGGTRQLYRLLFDRLVHFHGLNNLLWVWNPDRPSRADRQFVDYFPGLDMVDVLALDCYGAYEQSYYDDPNALSGGKVLGIGATSQPPALEVYQKQPKWAFYMKWTVDTPEDGGRPSGNGAWSDLRALVSDPRMLGLQDPAFHEGINHVRAAAGLEALPSPQGGASAVTP